MPNTKTNQRIIKNMFSKLDKERSRGEKVGKKEIGQLELVHQEKREKRNWLVRTHAVKYAMNQSKGDCIDWSCLPTNCVYGRSI